MSIEKYRTDPGEWVVGASVYRGRRGWVVNVELVRWVVTAYVGGTR